MRFALSSVPLSVPLPLLKFPVCFRRESFVVGLQYRMARLTVSGVIFFQLIAWHSFGRKPCARHRRSLCSLRNHRNNFALDCSRRSPTKRMKFFRSPIEITLWVWEQPPLASGCPGNGQKERNTHERQSAYNHRIHRPQRRNQATVERHRRHKVFCGDH
jgi:hypothetical protein